MAGPIGISQDKPIVRVVTKRARISRPEKARRVITQKEPFIRLSDLKVRTVTRCKVGPPGPPPNLQDNGDGTFTIWTTEESLTFKQGAAIHFVVDDPLTANAVEGDVAIDVNGWHVWQLTDTGWVYHGQIEGEKGDKGDAAAPVTITENGDGSYTMTNGLPFGDPNYAEVTWHDGHDGQDGQRGSLILRGQADPQPGDGLEGDWWINTSNWHYWYKSDQGWEDQGPLVRLTLPQFVRLTTTNDVFTAPVTGVYKFTLKGKGGNGRSFDGLLSTGGGGGGGGRAVLWLFLEAGEQVPFNVAQAVGDTTWCLTQQDAWATSGASAPANHGPGAPGEGGGLLVKDKNRGGWGGPGQLSLVNVGFLTLNLSANAGYGGAEPEHGTFVPAGNNTRFNGYDGEEPGQGGSGSARPPTGGTVPGGLGANGAIDVDYWETPLAV
ncbi:MAG: hypothetical protein ABF335_03225 [Alphaproteobacteria bacterium]